MPALPILDASQCIYFQRGKCRACEKLCQAKAIDFNQQPVDVDLEVGAVVLAVGSQEFQARLKDEYGYGTFPNVVTSIELERLLSASGPFGGHLQRPSDGLEPTRVAFIQCVGSRDLQVGREYCSAICCMQASKDAVIIAEHIHGVESVIFYMDVRAYGKGFDRFVDRARNEYGVRFQRSRISSVEMDADSDDIILQYLSERGEPVREAFPLVVLSVGLCSNPAIEQLVRRLGLTLNAQGFLTAPTFQPVDTARKGIFACGTITGPKDIPESVMEASGASAAVLTSLADFSPSIVTRELPAQRDIRGEPPRVGVFVCRCGINIGSTVNVPEVVSYAQGLPRVVHADERLFACSSDSQKGISEAIRKHRLNRVVVAACTPRTHEPLFQKTLEESGLNRYLFEFANIREQCSWVHQNEAAGATDKAKDLVRMAAAKAVHLRPLQRIQLTVDKSALVIGGGVAGMVAALDLAAQGYPVALVEREQQLGGNVRRLAYTLQGDDVSSLLGALEKDVRRHPNITVHTGTTVEEITGYVGNFHTRLLGIDEEIHHGVVVVATGAAEYQPSEYYYGQDARVVTQTEFEHRLGVGDPKLSALRTVVMIQCVGSETMSAPTAVESAAAKR